MNASVRLRRAILMLAVFAVLFGSCRRSGRPTSVDPGAASSATGLAFNEDSSFQVRPFEGQPEGPNLVFIEGGRMTLGSFEEDVMMSRDNLERTVTVASFYMDETEVANIHWLEYLFYIQDSTQEYQDAAQPNQEVWKERLAYNDPYSEQYLKYPGFRYFPVVGVSWVQANAYSVWRTQAVNQHYEQEAIATGAWDPDLMADAESDGRIPIESGIILPDYRLPSQRVKKGAFPRLHPAGSSCHLPPAPRGTHSLRPASHQQQDLQPWWEPPLELLLPSHFLSF